MKKLGKRFKGVSDFLYQHLIITILRVELTFQQNI